ncbi:MAG: B12-binding domain-containing radical SAM protein [Syntrophomonadaceae bacterium]
MKVLLTTLNAKYIHSCLALYYLKRNCQGPWAIETKEFSINDNLNHVMEEVYFFNPDVLCFSCYIWNIEEIRQLARDFKQVRPQTIIVFGGPEISFDAEPFLKENTFVDIIVRGEGEITLSNLLRCLYYKQDLANVKGITYRQKAKVRENPDQEVVINLDDIQAPYGEDNMPSNDQVIYYETSRGCPFNCTYCLSAISSPIRFFSLDRVKKDLSWLISKKPRKIKFVDRTFNCHEPRAMEIMKYLLEQDSSTRFHFEICADLLSDEMMSFLRTVPPGVFEFEIGVQSTLGEALRAVNRRSHWQRLQENIKKLSSFNNIHLHLDLIAGLPFEAYADFAVSFNDVYNLQPHVIQLGFLKILKGSPLSREAAQHGYLWQSRPPYQVLSNKYITYEQLVKLAHIEDLVERYYNSGGMKNTLAFLIKNQLKGDAFSFFQAFAGFWEERALFGVGHKKENEYDYLLSFVRGNFAKISEELTDILKFDFLINNQTSNLPPGFRNYAAPGSDLLYAKIKDQQFITDWLPEFSGRAPRQIRRLLHLDFFQFDPIKLRKQETPVALLFVYDPVLKKARKIINLSTLEVVGGPNAIPVYGV